MELKPQYHLGASRRSAPLNARRCATISVTPPTLHYSQTSLGPMTLKPTSENLGRFQPHASNDYGTILTSVPTVFKLPLIEQEPTFVANLMVEGFEPLFIHVNANGPEQATVPLNRIVA